MNQVREDVHDEKVIYDLFTGRKNQGAVMYSEPAGRAISFPGTHYYVLKLWALYNNTYFLIKKQNDDMAYTVFAKKIEDDHGVRFQNPVGHGWISEDMVSHLEIRFNFPRQSLFMSLYPAL